MPPTTRERARFRWSAACCLAAALLPGVAAAAGEGGDAFPYVLDPVWDSVLGGAAVLALTGQIIAESRVEGLGAAEIAALDPGDVNALDRGAIGNRSPEAARASDVLRVAAAALPAAVVIEGAADAQWRRAAILTVMAAEATLLDMAVTGYVKIATRRPRPYQYDGGLSLESRLEATRGATYSFYSGHASVAFCGAAFFSTAFADLHPRSSWRYAVWSLSLGLATTVGVLRVAAGKHFPTDVLAGAAAGGLIGWGVPALHRRRDRGAARVALLPASAGGWGLTAAVVF